jgi:hypothetical protein
MVLQAPRLPMPAEVPVEHAVGRPAVQGVPVLALPDDPHADAPERQVPGAVPNDVEHAGRLARGGPRVRRRKPEMPRRPWEESAWPSSPTKSSVAWTVSALPLRCWQYSYDWPGTRASARTALSTRSTPTARTSCRPLSSDWSACARRRGSPRGRRGCRSGTSGNPRRC